MGKNVLESSKKIPREKAREKKKKNRVSGIFLNEGEKENKIRGGGIEIGQRVRRRKIGKKNEMYG